eukprot:CAMPEP_0175024112 /NCGR_PEP_ID=MMETSP0005-20121125/16260_1 /TAXON_ID=420556 /ORGANISM="Ochromonas sp., Strain CCMP1393" /LENGTH=533 /DNA_ID=CAMNT_0016282577 /DNA_START=1 /DNA_END=1602 /DNA_ORIENTATION=+
MGGGASIGITRTEKRENIRDRNKLVRHVEKFILNVYSSSSRVDATWLILWNSGGTAAFSHFVESERADEYYTLFLETNKVRKVKKPTLFVLRKYVGSIIDDYLKPNSQYHINIASNLKKEMDEIMTDKLEEQHDPVQHIFSVINKLQVEMVNLMARDQMNRFLFSKFYKNWRANERGRAVASSSENSGFEIDNYYSNHPTLSKKHTESGKHTKVSRTRPEKFVAPIFPLVVPEDSLSSAFANFDPGALDGILDWQSWLSALIVAVEILPIAFSLGKPQKNSSHKGFPLIFVNKWFESSMGFKRTTVNGWNCKDFLQCAETEQDKIKEIQDGLKSKTMISTILTNINGKGERFNQLLVIKPILDERGHYLYVMALHVEVTDAERRDPEQTRQKTVEVLMETLPDVIIRERNEEEVPVCLEKGLATLMEMTRMGVDKRKLLENGSSGGSSSSSGGHGNGSSNGGGGGKVHSTRQASEALSARGRGGGGGGSGGETSFRRGGGSGSETSFRRRGNTGTSANNSNNGNVFAAPSRRR